MAPRRLHAIVALLVISAAVFNCVSLAQARDVAHHHRRPRSSVGSNHRVGGDAVPPAFDPVANPKAVVIAGNARFTVLTDSLVRMEWEPETAFQDWATWKVTVRNLPVPAYTSYYNGSLLTIKTQYFTLVYDSSSTDSFSRNNLNVTVAVGSGRFSTWGPGYTRDNDGNLFGTLRTLDGESGTKELDCDKNDNAGDHCTFGVASRVGYAVVDDSHTPVFTNLSAPWPWIRARHSGSGSSPPADQCTATEDLRRDCAPKMGQDVCEMRGCCWVTSPVAGAPYCFYGAQQSQDLYLFAHGHRYTDALRDLTAISGKIPMPPRFTFGVFYSRYWAYNEQGLEDIVQQYSTHGVPLDNLVIDMDWHKTFYRNASEGQTDQAGETMGWTGFSWDTRLFPNASDFLDWVHSNALRITMNLHPASGIQPWEDTYEIMARAMGIDPTTQKYVPFNLSDQTFIENWMNLVLRPLEQQGVDFWWLDWQQGEEWISKDDDVSPTLWLNYVFTTNPYTARPTQRPLLLHRWGGLGNHRYQIGFSGDTTPNWDVLDFQPYFTLTASNVGYGYWSHDLGGHTQPSPAELYTRWVQWGAFSPIFRTHCTKDGTNDRRIWVYPDTNFQIMRQAMVLRAALLPYIYGASRVMYDTGVSLMRPLYYTWPEADEAYTAHNQYMFGDELMVAPVTRPVNNVTQVAEREFWIPPGEWVSMFSLHHYTGPATFTENFTLHEIPVFARAGAILPLTVAATASSLGQAQNAPSALQLLVFPAATSGSYSLYEDDGISQAYQSGAYATTKFAFEYSSTTAVDFTIGAMQGSFSGMPTARSYAIHFRGVYPPTTVQVSSASGTLVTVAQCRIRYASAGQAFSVPLSIPPSTTEPDCWRYDGSELAIVVELRAPRALNVAVTVHVQLAAPADDALFVGLPGYLQRMDLIKDALDKKWCWSSSCVFHEDFPHLLLATQAGHRMTSRPDTAVTEVHQFAQALIDSVADLQTVNVDAVTRAQLLALLPSAADDEDNDEL